MNFSEPGCASTTTTTTIVNGSTPLHLARSLFSNRVYHTKRSDFTRHLTAIHDAAYLLLLPQTCRAEVTFHQAETRRISNGPLGDAVLQATTLFFLNTCRRDTVNNNNNASANANANDDDNNNAEPIMRTPPQQHPQNSNDAYTRTQHQTIHEATTIMLAALAFEEQRYLDNMTLLLSAMKRKWKTDLIETGSWHRTALTLGETGIASARALADLVGERATAPWHGGYLGEIARFWRDWTDVGMGTGEAGAYEEVWRYVAGRGLVLE